MGDDHDAGEWSWGPEDNSNGGDPDPVGEMNKRSAETPALQQGKLILISGGGGLREAKGPPWIGSTSLGKHEREHGA